MFLQRQHSCFLDLSNEKLCSISAFGNVVVRFCKVVKIDHDNVASRGAVGRCQIADMKPSKGSWNAEFRGFRVCVGWISTT